MSNFNGLQALETPEFLTARLDKLGGPESYNHYAVGWAHAMNTPYQWTKQVASHWGGTRNGTIVHWPKGIKAKGEIRSQFHHVIDVAPTILEAAGLPQPVSVNGVQQDPIEGVSMLYSFNDAKAAERHETQYFEMFGNRGIYHKGWTAVTKHQTPWAPSSAKTSGLRRRRLGALRHDQGLEPGERPGQADAGEAARAAAPVADRGDALQRAAARRPDGREDESRTLAGRPVLIKGKTQILFGGMGRLSENCVLNIKNKSHSVTAEIVVPEKGAEGVIIAQGGNIGGWSLYAKDGKLKYCYNWGGFKHFFVESADADPCRASIRCAWSSPTPAAASARAARRRCSSTARRSARATIGATLAMVFSADDGCDVGEDTRRAGLAGLRPAGQRLQRPVKGVQLAIADAAENVGPPGLAGGRRSASRWRGSRKRDEGRVTSHSTRVQE